jgi:hypothetical protein
VSWKRKMYKGKERCRGAYIKWINGINLFRDHRKWTMNPRKRYIRKEQIKVLL